MDHDVDIARQQWLASHMGKEMRVPRTTKRGIVYRCEQGVAGRGVWFYVKTTDGDDRIYRRYPKQMR